MDTRDRANHAGPAARNATFVSAWNVSQPPSDDAAEVSGGMRQEIAESSALLIDSLESEHADASYVTEWWLPCDETTAS